MKFMYKVSLPPFSREDVQLAVLHSVDGLENAKMMRTGYAIEYDVVKPYQLRPSLETKLISGLFTAGQMNGNISGYKKRAEQGLMVNQRRRLSQREEAFVMKRTEGYIGVMIITE